MIYPCLPRMGIPIKKPTVASDPILDLLPPGLPPSLPLHLPQPPSICAQTLDREWRRELSNIRRSSRSSLPPSQSLKGLTKKYLAFRSRSFRVVAHPGRGRSYASSKSSLLTRSGFSTGTSASMSMGPSRSIAACGSNLLQVGKLRSWLHVRVEAARSKEQRARSKQQAASSKEQGASREKYVFMKKIQE